jgi:hypothetical protein
MASDHNSNHYLIHFLLTTILLVLYTACDSTSSSNSNFSGSPGGTFGLTEWIVDRNDILDGGPGIDGIPSIDNPRFTIASDVTFLDDARRVTGIRIGDDLRAYPHQILDQHEIVNDTFEGVTSVAITFCPLTGTSIAVNRNLGGNNIQFGVSGLLFRNNLIMYDRFTASLWSQMQLRSIGGDMRGNDADVIQLIETTWDTWKTMYPDSKVLNRDTGFNRNYGIFVYGADYTTNHKRILFPVRNDDPRLNRKDRVHALIPDNANESSNVKAYPIQAFGNETTIIRDHFMLNDFLIAGNARLDIINAFKLVTEFEKTLELTPADDSFLPVVFSDQHGNFWDIFGYAVSGPNQGKQLTEARSYTGYWYALADFYPNIELYRN